MDLSDILIGCVHRVETEREGIELLNNSPDVAGVIWHDPIENLPELTPEEYYILSQSHVTWHYQRGLEFAYGNHETSSMPEHVDMRRLQPYFDMATRDVLSANKFKDDIERRKHWFLVGLGNDTQYHFDWKARNIWLHRHQSGGGLKVVFPTDNRQSLQMRVGPHNNRVVRTESLRHAFEEGLLSSVNLETDDVIAFNENMLHISHSDPHRIRTTVNGFARI